MTRAVRTDYAAVNAKGVTLYTFNDAAAGRAWVRERAALHEGLHLREVTYIQHSRRVYRPPVVKPDPFAIPDYRPMAGAVA